jgi:hypothetical protein
MTTTTARIHVIDDLGKIIFKRLIDDGSNVLRFESGFGFVARDDMLRKGWAIVKD